MHLTETNTKESIPSRVRRPHLGALFTVGLLAAASLLAAGCGSSGTSGQGAGSTGTTANSGGSPDQPSSSTTTSSCIPQNGGGDGDADNFGGPSDGDGCL